MGRDAPADGVRVGDAERVGDGADRGVFAEQVIRPTGLIDPPVEIKPSRSRSRT
jgi:excinuclease UvrABC helicase subunit UvrB